MDYSAVTEIRECTNKKEVNDLIGTVFASEEWILLDTAPGVKANGESYFLYSVGKVYREPDPVLPLLE